MVLGLQNFHWIGKMFAAHLHMACLTASHNKLAVCPKAPTICLILEAGELGPLLTGYRVIYKDLCNLLLSRHCWAAFTYKHVCQLRT